VTATPQFRVALLSALLKPRPTWQVIWQIRGLHSKLHLMPACLVLVHAGAGSHFHWHYIDLHTHGVFNTG